MSVTKALGIVWFNEQDYDRARSTFIDGHLLPPTFNDWLNKAQNLFDRLKRDGCIVEKVYINPDTFPSWCRSRSLNIDADARTAFASEFVARKYGNQNR